MKPSEFERLYGGQSDFLMRCYVLEQRYPNASDGRIACLAYFQSTEANPSLAHWLEGYGVDFLHCDNLAGPLTVPGIRVVADRFTIVSREEGESAVVVPVCDEHLRPLDLFAFRPDNPGRWWTFLDQTAVLGAANVINPSSFAYGAMPIHLNPLQWFRAGCEGGGGPARRARPAGAAPGRRTNSGQKPVPRAAP